MLSNTLNAYQEITLLAGDVISALNMSFRKECISFPTSVQGLLTSEWSLKLNTRYKIQIIAT
jgi:hypothetical protein